MSMGRIFSPRAPKLWIVGIRFEVICWDDTVAECVTFSSGTSEKMAIRAWNRLNPSEKIVSTKVLSGNGASIAKKDVYEEITHAPRVPGQRRVA